MGILVLTRSENSEKTGSSLSTRLENTQTLNCHSYGEEREMQLSSTTNSAWMVSSLMMAMLSRSVETVESPL